MLLTILERKEWGEVKGGAVNTVESPSCFLVGLQQTSPCKGPRRGGLQRTRTDTMCGGRITSWNCFFVLPCGVGHAAHMLGLLLLSFVFRCLLTHSLLPVSSTRDLKPLPFFNKMFFSERLWEIILFHQRSTTRLTSVALLTDSLPVCSWIFLVPRIHYF